MKNIIKLLVVAGAMVLSFSSFGFESWVTNRCCAPLGANRYPARGDAAAISKMIAKAKA